MNEGWVLNLAAWEERSRANGPGARFVLWVQGCPLRCPACINPEFWPFVDAQRVAVIDLAEQIVSVAGIEGVTYSGGEPSCQAQALAELSRRVKARGLTVMAYSGYTLEALRQTADPAVRAWLDGLDILVDGPYLAAQAAPLVWRGSSNQRVHFLSEAYRHLAAEVEQPRRIIELIAGQEDWKLTGTWEAEFQERLRRALNGGEDRDGSV